MNTPILKKLKRMMGDTFIYKGSRITLKDYKFLDNDGTLQVDIENGQPIKVKDFSAFIDECEPVNESMAISTEVLDNTNNLMSSLQQTLMENIANVKKDPNYIKQANTINSSVNSLVGLAKIQLGLAKMKPGR